MSRHGRFIWNELLTADPDAAAAFYGAVFGWRFEDYLPSRIGRYRLAFVDGDPVPVAGLLEWPAGEPGAGWFSYLEVDDLAIAAEAVVAGGGRVSPPRRIEAIGDVAYVVDPQGAHFALIRPVSPDCSHRSKEGADASEGGDDGAGRAVWNELPTPDLDGSRAFFAAVAGWSFRDFPAARIGRYLLATPPDGGADAAGLIEWPPGEDGAGWLVYFASRGLEATTAAVAAAGGRVEPIETLPGYGRASYATDPAGVAFGLFEAAAAD